VVQDIRPDTGSAADEDASARKGKQFVKGPTQALRAKEEEEETESSEEEEEEVSSKQKGRAKGLGGQGQQKARQAPARPDSRPPVEEVDEDAVETFAPRPTQRRQGGFFDESPQSQGPQKPNIDSNKKFFGGGAGKVTRGGFAPQDDSDDGIETIQTVEVAKPQAKKSAPRQKPKWSRPIGDDVASFDDSDDLDAEEA
jgi:hypothetical protein